MTGQIRKIDAHVHYFPPAYEQDLARHQVTILDGASKPKWSEEAQLEYMKQMNIDCSILSLSSPHFHFGDDEEAEEIARRCNEYGADLKFRYQGKFKIMGSLYYDVAGMSMPKQYGLLKKITEESHILYGSDAPFTPLSLCEKLEQDMLKTIEPENLNAVMYQNAVKLFD